MPNTAKEIEGKQAIVAECRASDMTAKEWCELKGIKYTWYVTWATTVNRGNQKDAPTAG
ncbi:IS66 family insertion sequence element accessory protein TnpA [Aneurinibacillus migulanus]|uniref:IS66 family insertion sequence element accessory protein TnpA n=1 Tax=Aneurinibacillus migulanus TaxID=47500 RepID=UPI000ADD3C10